MCHNTRAKAREARRRRLLGHMQKLEKVMSQPQAVPGDAEAGAAQGEEGAVGVVGATGSIHLEGGGRVRGACHLDSGRAVLARESARSCARVRGDMCEYAVTCADLMMPNLVHLPGG